MCSASLGKTSREKGFIHGLENGPHCQMLWHPPHQLVVIKKQKVHRNPVKNSGHNVTAKCAQLPRAIPKLCAEWYIVKESFLVCHFVSNEIIQCPIYFDTKCIIVIDLGTSNMLNFCFLCQAEESKSPLRRRSRVAIDSLRRCRRTSLLRQWRTRRCGAFSQK